MAAGNIWGLGVTVGASSGAGRFQNVLRGLRRDSWRGRAPLTPRLRGEKAEDCQRGWEAGDAVFCVSAGTLRPLWRCTQSGRCRHLVGWQEITRPLLRSEDLAPSGGQAPSLPVETYALLPGSWATPWTAQMSMGTAVGEHKRDGSQPDR